MLQFSSFNVPANVHRHHHVVKGTLDVFPFLYFRSWLMKRRTGGVMK